ncbi:MAG: general secretion pathway protein GspL [Geobacter sp.]|nr:MAG: general secretion pathway protein GspL [Geobacter sp.]
MTYLIVQLTNSEVLWGRFQRRRSELAFLEGGRNPLTGEPDFAGLLKELAGKRQHEEKVVLSLPPSSLFLREIDLPLADRRKARQVLPLELKGETAIDTDELVFDAIPLADGKSLAVWTRRSGVSDLIRTMTEAGLEPETVSVAPLHWAELLSPSDTTEPVAITDGEALAVTQNGRLLFCRPLADVDPVAEVARTLAALELGKEIAVREVFLHGVLAHAPATETAAGLTFRQLPLTGSAARAFAGDAETARDLASTYAVAAACVSGAAVNFRSGNLAYTAGDASARRKLRMTLVLAAILIVALIAETSVRYYLVRRDLNSLDTSILTVYRQVFPNRKKPVDAVGELKGEIRRLSGSTATGSVLAALTKAAELKGDDITGIYEAEFDHGQLRLKGDARSIQGVNDFKTRAAAAFSDGEVSEIKSKPDGTVSFQFRGTYKEEKK